MSQPVQQRSAALPVQSSKYDLQTLLNPVSADQFLAHDYGQRFLHVRGTPGKFASLLPWPVLNDILEQHRLEPPRLRLTREGKPIPPDRYLSYQSRGKKGSTIPRLNAGALTNELREGATLVLDNVDELHRPIRRLAESLEQIFRVRIQVNSYSGWRTSHGFDLHWDDHDVFILQIAGRKHWKVYGMTRPWPLARDSEPAVDPPSQVLWDGLLEDGDLLYIPRGWWHVATPLDEPTLHLTVGVNNPTGIDFLSWFVDRLRDAGVARRDLPHLLGSDAMRTHAELLREAILAAWRPDLLEEYMAHLDATAKVRPAFALPCSATPDVIPEGSYTVRWIARVNARIEVNGDQISVAAMGRRWKFRREARPLLELLMLGNECSRSELESMKGHMLTPAAIRDFLKQLAVNGLAVIR